MITSTANAAVKEIVQLQKKAKYRQQKKAFLVEGLRMVREIPEAELIRLYATEDFCEKYAGEIPKPELVTPEVFARMSETKTPQGVLAVVRQKEWDLSQMVDTDNALLLVLDHIQDPGNAGTIFRTGEAAGVTGIVLSADCVDVYNPKVVRSTMGSIFRMPFYYSADLAEDIGRLQKDHIRVYAASLGATQFYDQPKYAKKCAFLIGNEGNGLRKEVAACADQWIRIPMEGEAESLNASVAASILVYEVNRQRRVNRQV